ncbi:hypothetical protein [Vibrio splendidus]|uniref:hypothetical protein n=1 Tax=Vibrio splendidus TaxID=29497 RepID=UPI003D1372C4
MKKVTETIYHLAYMIGYAQQIPSRSLRRRIAGTMIHRAWLGGNQGCIGETEGVLYRNWHTNRKNHKNASFSTMWQSLRGYYGLYGHKKNHFLFIAVAKDILEID